MIAAIWSTQYLNIGVNTFIAAFVIWIVTYHLNRLKKFELQIEHLEKIHDHLELINYRLQSVENILKNITKISMNN